MAETVHKALIPPKKVVILAGYAGGTPQKLKKALWGSKIINPYKMMDNLKLKNKIKDCLVLNWGTRPNPAQLSILGKGHLNCSEGMAIAINKRQTFEALGRAGVRCLDFTTDVNKAIEWLNTGKSVFGRMLVEGSAGEGIVLAIAKDYQMHKILPEQFKLCKIWTLNFPKAAEVRVHVLGNEVVDYAEKRRVNDKRFQEDKTVNISGKAKPDFWIRNHGNGWVYCRTGDTQTPVERNKNAERIAIDAIRAVGLDFGAVDILIGGKGDAIVCEINTAPGLEGSGLAAYVDKIYKLSGVK